MIFCQYGYREFHNENKEKHPIQPYHWNNWVKMVNDNQRYCERMNWLKWAELYLWIMMGRVKKSQLPSFHRYWRLELIKQCKVDLVVLINKYEICRREHEQIKYLFNADTSLNKIEEQIAELKKRINS